MDVRNIPLATCARAAGLMLANFAGPNTPQTKLDIDVDNP